MQTLASLQKWPKPKKMRNITNGGLDGQILTKISFWPNIFSSNFDEKNVYVSENSKKRNAVFLVQFFQFLWIRFKTLRIFFSVYTTFRGRRRFACRSLGISPNSPNINFDGKSNCSSDRTCFNCLVTEHGNVYINMYTYISVHVCRTVGVWTWFYFLKSDCMYKIRIM